MMAENPLLSIFNRDDLNNLTRDLTDLALREKLEPVKCREAETERLICVLLRQSKNNPVLLGEAGVGKTAVVEGLAERIVRGQVPQELKRCRILALSHMDLLAGTSFRGQYEKRLQQLLQTVAEDDTILLFIDELHNLVGAGSALGQPLDAANMLKPALARGEIRVIGATTASEYDRFIRPDAALERRFHPIEVKELELEQTRSVLLARRPRLEIHHRYVIADNAIDAALDITTKIENDRKQPDKSIDLLDEACAIIRMRETQPHPTEVLNLFAELNSIRQQDQGLIDIIIEIAESRGNLLERFSYGTFRSLEAMGLGLEWLFTGRTTARRKLPKPDSVRKLEKNDPAGQLADLHCRRLETEDKLRELLKKDGFVIDAERVYQSAK
jgi:ATP-dependent Clp protease ATP-binding subunit ClpC